MLTLVDTFSEWIEASPMRSETASEVTQFLIRISNSYKKFPISLTLASHSASKLIMG